MPMTIMAKDVAIKLAYRKKKVIFYLEIRYSRNAWHGNPISR